MPANKTITEYVLGFMFDGRYEHVLLIKKNRPDWQRGRWNGIGGKIECTDIDPVDAMVREFTEETGLSSATHEWNDLCKIKADEYEVNVFYAWGDIFRARTITDELVSTFAVKHLPRTVLPNLRWMIPLAVDRDQNKYRLEFYV